MKNKDRKYYFGFDSQMDHPEWANGISTSLLPDRVQKPFELDYKNPFSSRLRRILKIHKSNVNIGFEFHTIFVEKGKAIRPLIDKVTKALLEAGWKVGDFNRNGRVEDIWDEYKSK